MTCKHCGRSIQQDENEQGLWIDPEATGDDSVWRETCDQHDTFEAQHEPLLTRESAIAILEEVAGGLNDGHARYPIPELSSVIDFLKDEPKPWKIGDDSTQPFIWMWVEGGVADWTGDTDKVEVVLVDYDFSDDPAEAIEGLDMAIERAERIPDRLDELAKDDPRRVNKAQILTELREQLAEKLAAEAGEEVFVTDDGIVPRCDICDKAQLVVGDDWNGETGSHHSCEDPQYEAAAGT